MATTLSSSLALAGYQDSLMGGRSSDGALLFVDPFLMQPLAGSIFGGPLDEIFASLAEVPPGLSQPPGYVLAGFTDSDWQGVGDPRNVYLATSDPAVPGCEKTWHPQWTPIDWAESWWSPNLANLVTVVPIHTAQWRVSGDSVICP